MKKQIRKQIKKPKILLANPPFPYKSYPGQAMGICYVEKALRKAGCLVESIDLDAGAKHRFEERFKRKLANFRPHRVGITNLSPQADKGNRIAELTKLFDPNTKVDKGGVHETFSYEVTLKYHPEVDFCFIGESEETYPAFIRAWASGVDSNNIVDSGMKGVAYYTGKKTIFNGPAPPPSNLDEHLPERSYHYPEYDFDIFGFGKTAQIMASRGCLNACVYCVEPAMRRIRGGKEVVRKRSMESIREELEQLQKDGFEAVYFDDSTFTSDMEWARDICKLMKEFNFKWGYNTRVDKLTREFLAMAKDAGCDYQFCGLESASPGVLRGFNKVRDPKGYLRSAKMVYKWMRELDILSNVFLIFGGPKIVRENDGKIRVERESFDDVLQTLKFAINELNPDIVSANVLRFLPGTAIANASRFNTVRPNKETIHGGFYDSKWYSAHGRPDIRSEHPIFGAFEGGAVVHPSYMTPEYCHKILEAMVDMVNENNRRKGIRTEIQIDNEFKNKGYLKLKNGVWRLAPLLDMG